MPRYVPTTSASTRLVVANIGIRQRLIGCRRRFGDKVFRVDTGLQPDFHTPPRLSGCLLAGIAQGQVYLGFDPRLRRRLAIKVRRLPTARRARRAALQEARQLAQLQDERVVRIHDVVVSSDYLALVMEYIPGCDLEALLSAGPLSLGSILH